LKYFSGLLLKRDSKNLDEKEQEKRAGKRRRRRRRGTCCGCLFDC